LGTGSGFLRESQGSSREGCGWQTKWRSSGETCKQALFLMSPSAARNLHGKEGVDGSSPSEGFTREERPANTGLLLPLIAPHSTSASVSGPSRPGPAFQKVPANRHVARHRGAPPRVGERHDTGRSALSRKWLVQAVCGIHIAKPANTFGAWGQVLGTGRSIRPPRRPSGDYWPRLAGSTPAKVRKSFIPKDEPEEVSVGVHFGFCTR
jgi:hypothetical protein